MTTEQKQVREFMQLFGQETPEKPTIMVKHNIVQLRANLILEEAIETIKALGCCLVFDSGKLTAEILQNVDLVELADGMADSHYVNYCGTACAFGIDMEPIFAEVHRSNMSKMWTVDEYEKSMNYPIGLSFTFCWDNDPTNSPMQDDRCWLAKNKDGKVVKSPSYSPANIQAEIDKQLL
jgi:hypothetical protein